MLRKLSIVLRIKGGEQLGAVVVRFETKCCGVSARRARSAAEMSVVYADRPCQISFWKTRAILWFGDRSGG